MSTAKDGSIEKVVEAAVQAQVQKMIVESQLTAQKKEIASALVLSLAKAAGSAYSFKVVIGEQT